MPFRAKKRACMEDKDPPMSDVLFVLLGIGCTAVLGFYAVGLSRI